MCGCGTSAPSAPSSSGSSASSAPAAAPATSPVASCPHAASELLVVDELGLPYRSASVTVRIGGGTFTSSTDANGKICLSLAPGTSFEIELAETHEGKAGDSTSTASGRHFSAGGTGP